jgi:hypothetical protein
MAASYEALQAAYEQAWLGESGGEADVPPGDDY